MKKNSFFTLTVVLIIFLSILSCTKTEEIDKLPPMTTEGTNTFGCLVNGKAWIPKTDGGLLIERLSVYYANSFLNIQANYTNEDANAWQIVHVKVIFNEIGFFQIPPAPSSNELFINLKNHPIGTTACTSYKCNPEDTEIEILYINTSERIISGTFNYKNLKSECGNVINITDGRFDVRY